MIGVISKRGKDPSQGFELDAQRRDHWRCAELKRWKPDPGIGIARIATPAGCSGEQLAGIIPDAGISTPGSSRISLGASVQQVVPPRQGLERGNRHGFERVSFQRVIPPTQGFQPRIRPNAVQFAQDPTGHSPDAGI